MKLSSYDFIDLIEFDLCSDLTTVQVSFAWASTEKIFNTVVNVFHPVSVDKGIHRGI